MRRYVTFLDFVLVSFSLLFMCSCKHKKDCEVIKLPSSIMTDSAPLTASLAVPSEFCIAAKDLALYGDSVLVVTNKPLKGRCMIEFWNLKTGEKMSEVFHNGNGPGEMLNVTSHIRGDSLFVHDFAKHQIAVVDMHEALLNGVFKSGRFVSFCRNAGSPFVTMWSQDRLIMLNPYYFENEDLGISNGQPRILSTNVGDDAELLGGKTKRLFYSYNVEQGCLVPSPSGEKLFFASSNYPEIEIYDSSLNLHTRIWGPDEFHPSYKISEGEICFDKKVPYTYRAYFAADDGLYLSYAGFFYDRKFKFQNAESWVFKFDWDGNFIKSYHSDKYLSSLSLSSDGKTFYGKGYDENGNVVLWRLTE